MFSNMTLLMYSVCYDSLYVHVHRCYIISTEMYGKMHPNYCHVTNLFTHDPLGCPMFTHTHPIASNFPIQTLEANANQFTNPCNW